MSLVLLVLNKMILTRHLCKNKIELECIMLIKLLSGITYCLLV